MRLFLNSDPKLEAQRQRLSSVATADLLPCLEGVELGAGGKVNICNLGSLGFVYMTHFIPRATLCFT